MITHPQLYMYIITYTKYGNASPVMIRMPNQFLCNNRDSRSRFTEDITRSNSNVRQRPNDNREVDGEIAQFVESLPRGPSRFTPGTIRLFQKGGVLSECYLTIPTSADDWLKKRRSMCHYVCVIMHVKDP